MSQPILQNFGLALASNSASPPPPAPPSCRGGDGRGSVRSTPMFPMRLIRRYCQVGRELCSSSSILNYSSFGGYLGALNWPTNVQFASGAVLEDAAYNS